MPNNYFVATRRLAGIFAFAMLLGFSGTLWAQSSTGSFGGALVPTGTVSTVTSAISDAISSAVADVLNAKPVVDREKVEGVNGLAVGSGSKHMVTALSDGSIGLWDVDQGRETTRIKGHVGEVKAVVVSESANTVASIGADGQSQVWSLSSGRKIASFSAEEDKGAQALALTADGKMAVTGHKDGVVRLWDTATGKEVRSFAASGEPVVSVSLDRANVLMAAGDKVGGISVWNLKTGNRIASFEHGEAVNSLAFLGEGSLLGSAGEDGIIKIWDTAKGKILRTLEEGDGAVKSIASSRDGGHLVGGGADGKIRLFNVATGTLVRTFTGHSDPVTYVTFGKDDAVIHTASKDGTSRIFERDKGAELARVVSSKGGWAVFNNSGDYDGGGDAVDAVSWVAEDNSFDMDQFAESHYEPGVLARAATATKAETKTKRPNLSVKFATPPAVAFSSPQEETKSDKKAYKVSVEAADLGGGIIEMRLYQNGKLVAAQDVSGNKEKQFVREFNVSLIAGENKFRVIGLSRDRIESRPAKVAVKYTGAERGSTLHVVTIGINKYRNPALNLNYGVPDAKGLQNFFGKQPLKLFKEVKQHTLQDRDATRPAIQKLITGLAKTQPQDVVIIYYAGHGETVDGNWYLMPTEITYPEREDHIRKKGILSKDLDKWIAGVGAQKVVMLMDACKSGAALKAFRGFEERKALSRLARASGIHVVASAGKNQFAVELQELGHGAFTFTLLEGLEGGADRGKDGTITVRELTSYIEDQLPELSDRTSGKAQFPVINSRGQDFPLAVRL